MKVFLSWSKPRSQRVAELLNNWIPCVLQSVETWFSSQNIEDGELWFNSIQGQVAEIINGVICLTKENVNEPWILFEAGGLAKGLEKSRIYILLIDLSSNDILLSPLSAFNHTKPTEDGIRKLMHVINGRTVKPISPSVVDQVFNKFWPDFETKFNQIIATTEPVNEGNQEQVEVGNDKDIQRLLEEILKNVRTNSSKKVVRNNSAHRGDAWIGITKYNLIIQGVRDYVRDYIVTRALTADEGFDWVDDIANNVNKKYGDIYEVEAVDIKNILYEIKAFG